MDIIEGGLEDPRVVDLVHLHATRGLAENPPGTAFPLDIAKLKPPEVRFWTVWDDGALLACGALRRLSAEHAELKSMHTVEAARRRGIGAALLKHMMAEAEREGIVRLSLRTGSWPYFHAARELYRRHGFVECPPFEGHAENAGSVFMTRSFGGGGMSGE
jgi:putative acetyltransferase